MKALTGIKVIDFSKWLPGQYCGMVLGDFGALMLSKWKRLQATIHADFFRKRARHELLAFGA